MTNVEMEKIINYTHFLLRYHLLSKNLLVVIPEKIILNLFLRNTKCNPL